LKAFVVEDVKIVECFESERIRSVIGVVVVRLACGDLVWDGSYCVVDGVRDVVVRWLGCNSDVGVGW